MDVVVTNEKKRKWKKRLLWIIGIVILIVIIIFTSAYFYLSRSLPKIEGNITLSVLQESVTVTRDEMGVPHIQAKNEHDLYIAQGYIQAQDRLFHMDLSRRQASGTLSEVVGEATVDQDKYFRTLGLRRAAELSYNEYSTEAKAVLKNFSDGVNLYIQELKENGKWPIEFTVLGYEPEAWTEIDSLTIGKYMAFDLGGHWKDQAFRYYLLQNFPKEKAYDLFPTYPEDAPYIISKEDLDLSSAFASAIIPHEFNGSNNWVLSGNKTESGKPLLADDPHLSLSTPSIWYQMHLQAPTVNVSGVIFAGIPGIILGHNEKIAWGVTNTGPDVQDLYIEKRNANNEFLYNEQWENPTVISEPIKVKGGKIIDYEVTITRHGPVISEFAAETGKEHVLSLQWTALEPSSELEAVLEFNKAGNWGEFEKALEKFHTPAQNFVFASTDGTIAYKAYGKIPIRKKGDGLLPVPGWTDEYGWSGYIPFNELPQTVNPTEGYISTANNKVVSDSYLYHISHNWAQPYRQMRIQEFLTEKDTYTVEDMKTLQMDEKNLQGEEFIPLFIERLAESKDKRIIEALEILNNWNLVDDAEQSAPLIFNVWMSKIPTVLFADDIPKETYELFGGRKMAVDELLRDAFANNEGPWMKENGGLTKVLEDSLLLTLDEIKVEQGANMEQWKWGKYHQVRFDHPLSGVSPLHLLFNSKGAIATGGSSVTVKAAAFQDDGIVNHGGSWRFVADLADLSKTWHLVGPGQSGHLLSEWYQNQLDDWVNGDYHETVVEEMEGKQLILQP